MAVKRCIACGDAFTPRPQVPSQAYCSTEACQRERRKLWQRDKRRQDADYQDNQKRANKKWLSNQVDYWQRYRKEHPDYAERNREQQRARNAARSGRVAKMDVSSSPANIKSGVYKLTPHRVGDVANMDVWIVQLTVLSGTRSSER
jgi:hypothetical protein